MNYRATRQSWKTLDLPVESEHFDFSLELDASQTENLKLGLIPQQMEDKWFASFEEDWLYFHRSWTGHCIYAVKFVEDGPGLHAVTAWASRGAIHFGHWSVEEEKTYILFLINSLMRDKPLLSVEEVKASLVKLFQVKS